MLDDDNDLIEQVSEDDEDMDDRGQRNNNSKQSNHRQRLADQTNIDDEPPLQGYQR